MASPKLFDFMVRRTRCGKGVFAKRRFRRGQSVGHMNGRIVSNEACDPSYCVDLGRRGVLDPLAPFRYLNHSCSPNCELIEWQTDAEPQIWVQAVRTIQEGEELTIDYQWHADAAIPCLCGEVNCRGYVVDARQMHLLLKRSARARA